MMRGLAAPIAFVAGMAALVGAAAAQPQAPACESGNGRTGLSFTGEISGRHAYVQELPTGWLFVLEPAEFGWHLRLWSNLPGDAPGLDLTMVTPPFNGPNPREIYGWHFRNAANTGPNEGDVNAPQATRDFYFSPELIGTGGFRPPGGVPLREPSPDDGRGFLRILDYGLADLLPGQQARMVYLAFEVCLTWPSRYDPVVPLVELAMDAGTVERIRACGLDPALEPVALFDPVALDGDFDGDGVLDLAVPVVRSADGKRAVAICRAGTWLQVVGLEGTLGLLDPAYFDRMDIWRLEPAGPINPGVGEGPPPTARGDKVLLGIAEVSSVLLYWDGEMFQAYWQGD
jgi:hypothetical protein